MSVAETSTPASISRNTQQQLAIGSALGGVAVLAALWFIFAGLPEMWGRAWESAFQENLDLRRNLFLSDALLILLDLIVIGGFAFAAYRVLQQQTLTGLRAGIFFGALYLAA